MTEPAAAPRTGWAVTVPGWHPARLNQWDGRHWAVRARLKRADRAIVAAYVRAAGVPPATGKRRVSLHIVLGPRARGGDPDAYWKSLLDAMVACGALADDGKAWVETTPVTYSRGPRASLIRLEDM